MPASLSTVSAILKEVYEGPIQDQLQNETVGLKRIERSSEGITHNVGGKYVVFPLRTKRNAGIGARNEMEALPSPGQQGYAAAQVKLKYEYGAARITGQTFELADKDFQAFASAADMEISGLKDDVLKDQNRQFYGDGSGRIATASGAGTGNTFNAVTAKYLEVGQQIDIIDGTTLANATPTVKASNRQITAVDVVAKTATFDGATQATATGDIIVRTGSVNREWTGLAAIVSDTGILYNINPTTDPYWKAVVDHNSGVLRPLSEGLMIYNCDRVRANGSRTTAMFSGLGVRRAYFELLVQQRRYTNTQTFEGGFSGLAFTTDTGDIPFVVDIDCPDNTIYGINEKEIKLYREGEWSFMEKDGSMWQRVVAVGGVAGNYDAYEATLYMYAEIGTHRRNAHWVMRDITEG